MRLCAVSGGDATDVVLEDAVMRRSSDIFFFSAFSP